MYVHLYRYCLKKLAMNKGLIFWSLCFPIMLGTMFQLAFGNLGVDEFEVISVAVVSGEDKSEKDWTAFYEMLKVLSEGDDPTLDIKKVTAEEADQLLKEEEISGIITIGAELDLSVRSSDISTSILRTVLDQYVQMENMIETTAKNNPEKLPALLENILDRKTFLKETSFTKAKIDMMDDYFFALLAMAILYSSSFGYQNMKDTQANLSSLAARRSVAPVNKMKIIISEFLATLTICFLQMLIVYGYLVWGLKRNLGDQTGYVLLTILVGCGFAIIIGMFWGAVPNIKDNVKESGLNAFVLICCFAAGLMIGNMKSIVEHAAPFLNRINPAALLSDAFYSLQIYETHSRFYRNIGTLFIMSVLLCIATFVIIRRKKYASI